MSTVHDVLRYLLERVPHSTQDEHDRIAAVIEQDEHPQTKSAAKKNEPHPKTTPPPAEEDNQS